MVRRRRTVRLHTIPSAWTQPRSALTGAYVLDHHQCYSAMGSLLLSGVPRCHSIQNHGCGSASANRGTAFTPPTPNQASHGQLTAGLSEAHAKLGDLGFQDFLCYCNSHEGEGSANMRGGGVFHDGDCNRLYQAAALSRRSLDYRGFSPAVFM
jgi:hypothetical protein